MIAALAALTVAQTTQIDHGFVYRAAERLKKVNLAGSFNGWNKDADAMQVASDGLTWTKHLKLQPGVYTYKFVLDGDRWITDPKAYKNIDDGNGNTNSELLIAPASFVRPARKGDGFISTEALYHLTEAPFLNYDRGALTLSVRTRKNDVAHVKLSVDGMGTMPMTYVGSDDFYERYSAKVPWNLKHNVRYRFVVDDGKGAEYFGPNGVTRSASNNAYFVSAKTFKPFTVPDWVEHSVIYHIFPDRFANGDKGNDPKGVVPWDAQPTFRNYFGGDIAGVEQHLGYLKNLGISAIYLNPIFKSPVNHRYETTDYLQIDPAFGTNQEFVKLTKDLKQSGIRTVLDGVFNHTATSFAPFADVVKNGASSKYSGWYTFKSFPVHVGENPNYVAWFNYPSLPKVNYGSPDATRYMLGVPEYWQDHAAIAGWRLDAANEVTSDFWRAFRQKVKSIDKNAWIVGEVWGDGTPWLKGDQWDSVMNYQFREAVLRFVTKTGTGKPSQLMNRLMAIYNSYVPQVSRNMMNLIGSHDTARIMTLCEGDRSLAKLAAIVQFTWVGAPSVYYGDELGMEGGRDPDNRRGMTWSAAKSTNDVLDLYKRLIHIRNANLPLQSGDPIPIMTDDAKQVLAFARVLGDKADIVAINRSNREQYIDLNLGKVAGIPKSATTAVFDDALSRMYYFPVSGAPLSVRLAPRSAAVLIPRLGSSVHSRHDLGARKVASLATSKALVLKEPQ